MDDWRVDQRKILDYLLNPRSATGAAKSRFFQAGGFTREAWQALHAALVAHALTAALQEVDASSPYGEKQVFRCNISTPDGRDPCIRTVWQKRDGDFWLVTAYPFD
jgi:filamentous hemagglutinin